MNNDVIEMKAILKKLESGIDTAAKRVVKENKEEGILGITPPVFDNGFFDLDGYYGILKVTEEVYGTKKDYFSITENGVVVCSDICLYETCLALLREYVNGRPKSSMERIIEIDNRYNHALVEALRIRAQTKNLTGDKFTVMESKFHDAKHKLTNARNMIKYELEWPDYKLGQNFDK